MNLALVLICLYWYPGASYSVTDIFDHYDRRLIPMRNRFETLNITMTMSLYQILKFDEPQEYVSLNVWLSLTWQDDYLAWDPKLYNGLDRIIVPWNEIWTSDLILYNGLDMSGMENLQNVEIVMLPSETERGFCLSVDLQQKCQHVTRRDLSLKGNSYPMKAQVRLSFPVIYRFSCNMDVYYFPFDVQTCTMTFGSWTYDVTKLDINPNNSSVNLENYVKNEQWHLVNFTSTKKLVDYSCCPQAYAVVEYLLVVQRRPLLFVCNFVITTSIIVAVSIVGFFTPANTSGTRVQKIHLGVGTISAMNIFLLMSTDSTPMGGNHLPLMARFFLANIMVVAVATAMSTAVIFVHRRGRHTKQPKAASKSLLESFAGSFSTVGGSLISRRYSGVAATAESTTDDVASLLENPRRPSSDNENILKIPRDPTMIQLDPRSSKGSSNRGRIRNCRDSAQDGTVVRFALASNLKLLQGENLFRKRLRSAAALKRQLSRKRLQAEDQWELLATLIERICLAAFLAAVIALVCGTLMKGWGLKWR